MKSKLEKEVQFLKLYAVAATLCGVVFFASAFTLQDKRQKFEEIDVERINIVEKDGKLKMVISNKERQHPGVMDGKVIQRYGRPRPPGILFFNEIGDECGGLSYDGDQDKGQSLGLSFDKFRQDQTIQLFHTEGSDGQNRAGLVILDRLPRSAETELMGKFRELDKKRYSPEKASAMKALKDEGVFGFERLSLGKGQDQAAAIRLSDPKGRVRINLSVDAAGVPKLEFLDETGKVTHSLPQDSKR